MKMIYSLVDSLVKHGFHYTKKTYLKSILENGLQINSPANFRNEDKFLHLAYNGIIPIHFSLNINETYKDEVLLKVDVSGLNIGADIGSLIHFGAYLDENSFYFRQNSKWANHFNNETEDSLEYEYKSLYNNDGIFPIQEAIKLTGTFVVLENIPKEKIQVIKN